MNQAVDGPEHQGDVTASFGSVAVVGKMTPEGLRGLLEDLGSTALHESNERNSRVRIWKLLHYAIGSLVTAFGVVSGTVVLVDAGMTKQQAGVLLLIGGAVSAVYTFWNARGRMNTNFAMRDDYRIVARATREALALVNPSDTAEAYERIKLRYDEIRKADSASRAG